MCKKEKDVISSMITYPHFISNQAKGDDKLQGASQENLANAICKHITENDQTPDNKIPKIIGIEGSWGSGKTNVVRNLERKLQDKYCFFEYDAWGHQEDLQRRSILETLTEQLLDKGFLPKEKKVTPSFDDRKKMVSWGDKLKDLLAHKRVTHTQSIPVIDGNVLWLVLAFLLVGVTTFIAEQLNIFWYWKTLIAFSPVIVALFVWIVVLRLICKKKQYTLSYFLKINKEGSTSTDNYETINEEEPSVAKFKRWMQDLSDFISENEKHYKDQKKLILVFDNMDRLQPEQVREFWSSIHTFFAEEGFENIWVIVPFDRYNLRNAFCTDTSENNKAKTITDCYLQKTFPIVYRVAPPVLTDYKQIFKTFFSEAFGNTYTSQEMEIASRIYRLEKKEPIIRDIILFVNQLVALRQQWNNKISLVGMTLYSLFFDKINVNPEDRILGGEFLGSDITKVISYDESVKAEIAALYYGIEINHAQQLPLTKYISDCLDSRSQKDINSYSDNSNFDIVLEDVVEKMDDVLIDDAIIQLHKLHKDNEHIQHIWEQITGRKCKTDLQNQDDTKPISIILLHLNSNKQKEILDWFYEKSRIYPNFKGDKYFKGLKDLDVFCETNGIVNDATIQEKTIAPEQFISYLKAANNEYNNYPVLCDSDKLDAYLTAQTKDVSFKIFDIVNILCKDSKFQFDQLKNNLNNIILQKDLVKTGNVREILSTFRLLSATPITILLPTNKLNSIEQEMRSKEIHDGYDDVVASLIAQNQNVPYTDMMISLDKFVPVLLNYTTFEQLLQNGFANNYEIANQAVKYLIENEYEEELTLSTHINKFSEFKNRLGVSNEQIFHCFSKCFRNTLQELTPQNIKNYIPVGSSFYDYAAMSKDELSKRINEVSLELLEGISEQELYNTRNGNNFNHMIISRLIDTDYMKALPEKVQKYALLLLKEIINDQGILPLNESNHKLLEKLDEKIVSTTIKDIINACCNAQKSITPSQFLFYEPWFKKVGDYLMERADMFTHNILEKVFSNKKCRESIIQNQEFYIPIVKKAGADAKNLKEEVSKFVAQESALKDFAKLIGIEENPLKK